MSTWNRLDLQILGSQLIMLKNLPYHWNIPEFDKGKTERREHVTSWTCKH